MQFQIPNDNGKYQLLAVLIIIYLIGAQAHLFNWSLGLKRMKIASVS